ncbi:O-antigen translocase [Pseudomonas rubra]|uniref:O-antigen translocase n=1 Tax=Pseudomonas rubra TaxID=2942627 RepID=A0ABT5P5C4_9PSED|nr:O-antigen translocase [Pseudomonas rubra]MDD1013500.1 O-antigen translocase [Pseudomonas rubra]MDD1040182.1 O-antigen translocase [Pseudomonas rubra]MDD1155812.1 O-antigen translocase [Pseudomonas rubra]
MKAVGSALLTSVAHLSRIAVGFLLIKLIAFYLGPEGLGALGHFMSLCTIVYMLAGGGVTNAIIKYTAEYAGQPRKLLRFISVSTSYSFFGCVLVGGLGVLLSKPLAVAVFNDAGQFWLIVFLSLAVFGFAFVNMVVGVGNGLIQTHVYSRVQLVGSLLAVLIVFWLTSSYGMTGGALSVVVIYLTPVVPALFIYWRSVFRARVRIVKLKMDEFKQLAAFSGMLFVSAVSFPVVEIIIRQWLIESAGFDTAGLWQGLIKLSAAYLGFFTIFLSYYFMPLISRVDAAGEVGRLTVRYLLAVAALFAFGGGVLFWGREFFIPLILSEKFHPASDYLHFQLVGDFFRVVSYVIGFVAVAKASFRLYVAAELLQNGLFLGFSFAFLKYYPGVDGVVRGYVATYVVYLSVAVLCFLIYLSRAHMKRGRNAVCR